MITIVRPRLQRRRARTSRRAWTTSSPSRSPARSPARWQARRPVRSLRELRLPLQLHQLHFRLVTTALHLIQPLSHLHHKLFNFQFLQTTGRASPLDRDSASPLPVVEAKNRSIILKQEDFVKKKEEPVKKKEEEKKMEKTSSRSGLSCLRPNTLDEDTEAFTRCISTKSHICS